MGELSVWHWLIVVAVAVVLFGSNKLPDAARAVGRSLRIFKSEMREMRDDGADGQPTAGHDSPAPPPAAGPAVPGVPTAHAAAVEEAPKAALDPTPTAAPGDARSEPVPAPTAAVETGATPPPPRAR